jgi:hypothetical protein
MAYVADLYDTPSGHLDPGYVLSTTTGSGILATRIGAQAWTDCQDADGNKYEFKLTPDEYAALAQPDAQMPQEIATADAELATSSPPLTEPSITPPTSDTVASTSTPPADDSAVSTDATTTAPLDQSDATSTTDLPAGTATSSTPSATDEPTASSTPPDAASTTPEATAVTATTTTQ